jgi:hypothetical protein
MAIPAFPAKETVDAARVLPGLHAAAFAALVADYPGSDI